MAEIWKGTVRPRRRLGVFPTPAFGAKVNDTKDTGESVMGTIVTNSKNGYQFLKYGEENYLPIQNSAGTVKHLDLEFVEDTSFYRVLHDEEMGEVWRAGFPEVFLFSPEWAVKMDRRIQKLQYEIFRQGAPSQTEERAKKKWRVVYGHKTAYTNGNGFENPDDPRADYINLLDLDFEEPKLDKPRVNGGASLKGRKGYSLALAIRSLPSALSKRTLLNVSFCTKVRTALLTQNILHVETIPYDSELPRGDELIQKPWLYFHATTARDDGTIGRFPQGDGEPVLIPLITKTPVTFPLAGLQEMDDIADPYKIYL